MNHFKSGDVCQILGGGTHCGKVIILTRRVRSANGWAAWLYQGKPLMEDIAEPSRKMTQGDAIFEHRLKRLIESPGVDEIVLVRMARLQGSATAAKALANRRLERDLSPRVPVVLHADSNNARGHR